MSVMKRKSGPGAGVLMELLPESLAKKIPALYSTENVELNDKVIVAKFFNPCGGQTWYIAEYSPEDRLAFGYCDLGTGFDPEWGYISLEELESLSFNLCGQVVQGGYLGGV